MKTYAIVNKKGGVGKTTTAKNLAYILAVICKKRVLLIDADPQGNASSIVPYPNEAGLSSLLYYGGAEWYPDLIDHTDIPGLDLMPCGKDLDELDLACMLGRRNALDYLDVLAKLLEVIAGDDEYDVVVIDCPPSLYSLGCLNALRAADRLIVPTDSSVYSATGMADLLRQISLIRQNFPHLTVSGALITRYRADDVSQDAVDYLRQESPIPIFQTVIRASDAKVAEATWAGQVDQQWSPWCSASRDYRAWVAELMEKEEPQDGKV